MACGALGTTIRSAQAPGTPGGEPGSPTRSEAVRQVTARPSRYFAGVIARGSMVLRLLPDPPGGCAAEHGPADLDHALVSLPGPGARRRVQRRVTTATALTDTVQPFCPSDRRLMRR